MNGQTFITGYCDFASNSRMLIMIIFLRIKLHSLMTNIRAGGSIEKEEGEGFSGRRKRGLSRILQPNFHLGIKTSTIKYCSNKKNQAVHC